MSETSLCIKRVFQLDNTEWTNRGKEEEELLEELAGLTVDGHSNRLEQLLVDKLSTLTISSASPIINFLLTCYQKLEKENGSMSSLIAELEYLILSYMGLVLTMPTMFPQSQDIIDLGPKVLVPYLIGIDVGVSSGAGGGGGVVTANQFPVRLIPELIERFKDDDEMFSDLFEPILMGIVEVVKKEGILGRYQQCLDAIQLLLKIPNIQQLLINSPNIWTPSNCPVGEITSQSFLAALMSIGVDSTNLEPLHELLPNRSVVLYESDINSANYALRMALDLFHTRVHQLLYAFIKASAANKDALLKWLAWLAKNNENRLKMHVDPKTVNAASLIANVLAVLLKFCSPFLTPGSLKISLIDPLYYFKSDRIDVNEATKNNATSVEANEFKTFLSQSTTTNTIVTPYAANFVTECFYLTVQYFRLGLVKMINEYMELLRNLRDAQQALDHFESSQTTQNGATNMNSLATKNAKRQIQLMKDSKLAFDVYLLDERLMDQVYSFITLMTNWLALFLDNDHDDNNNVNNITKGEYEKSFMTTDKQKLFRMLPEFFIECIGEYLLFTSRFRPEFWLDHHGNNLDNNILKLMVRLLDQNQLVKNPYVRAKFVDFMFGLANRHFEHHFDSNDFVIKHLTPKLMRFYIEVESTGASSAFYEKFNIRYNISTIFKTLWRHPPHHARLVECSKDTDLFTRFTNLLLNDVTFLLDESISKLTEIHERQVETSSSNYLERPARERQERENGLRTLERQCESYMQLALSTLELLEKLTVDIVEPFLRPEIVDRLAAMLSFNIIQLVGPKCSNLKVQNPERYHWEPKTVLGLVIGILLNMSRKEKFLKAIARDNRSFSVETFTKAVNILRRHAIRPELDIQRLERIIKRVSELVDIELQQAVQVGEIPEEFLDPLMFTLMEDPVILETSKVIVDKSTIIAHLLNDPTDPFNRMPLTMDQVKGADDLKLSIQKFKKEHGL